jgi:N6-adenosine-specific RNA methylase IME4
MSKRGAKTLGLVIDRDLKRGAKIAKKFRTGLIDPPWQTLTYSGTGLPQRAKKQHYDTMSLDELKAMPVGDLFEADACLFMWSLGSHVDQAIRLAEHWGFKFNTDVFYWRKITKAGMAEIAGNPDLSGLDHPADAFDSDTYAKMGMGKWARKQIEPCYLFTRGKPSPIHGAKTGVRQIIDAPIREHSRKPDEIYGRIEAIAPGPFVELFSRTTAKGWSVWGNETGKFDTPAERSTEGRRKRTKAELLG